MLARSLRAFLPPLLLTACAAVPTTSVPGGDARLHVVLFSLKPDAPAAERAAFPAAVVANASEVRGVGVGWAGTPAGTQRAVVDNSYGVIAVMRFHDAAALAA